MRAESSYRATFNKPADTKRAGFAILAAIFSIVVVSLLALTGLYVARNDASANDGLHRSWKAFYAADAGASIFMATWESGDYKSLNPGDSVDTGWRTLDNGTVYRTTVLRVDDGATDTALYRLRTVGRASEKATAQRSIVTLVQRFGVSDLCCESALKVGGGVRVQGTGARVKISGLDADPASWGGSCNGTPDDLPGVTLPNLADLQIVGTPELDGDPPVLEDPTIEDSDFEQFGAADYNDLAAAAEIQFEGSQTLNDVAPVLDAGGDCDTSVDTNWGDPSSPSSACFDYMPLVHVAGDLSLPGIVVGQGVLLVDGNLKVTGTLDFYGLVIVQGEADFRGDVTVTGGMMVRNGMLATDNSSISGNAQINYSSCVASRAIANAWVTLKLKGRHWFAVLE